MTRLPSTSPGRAGGLRRRAFALLLAPLALGGIEPFDRLVWQVMTEEPYASARRVFWIVDNGSAHRGQRAKDRLESRRPNLILVHLPVHASWLNHAEIYFSIAQRKLLQPNDFTTTRSPSRSTGASREPTSTSSCCASPPTNSSCRSSPDQ